MAESNVITPRPMCFRHLVLEGTAYEAGRQLGEFLVPSLPSCWAKPAQHGGTLRFARWRGGAPCMVSGYWRAR